MEFLFVGDLPYDVVEFEIIRQFSEYGHVTDCVIRKNPAQRSAYAYVGFNSQDAVAYVQMNRPHYLHFHELTTRRTLPPYDPLRRNLAEDPISYRIRLSAYPMGTNLQIIGRIMSEFGTVINIEEEPDYQEVGGLFGQCIVTFDDWDSVDLLLIQSPFYIEGCEVILSTNYLDAPQSRRNHIDVSTGCCYQMDMLPHDEPYWPEEACRRQPLGALQNTEWPMEHQVSSINTQFAGPNQNLNAAKKKKKWKRALKAIPVVPLNINIDPVIGQDRKRKRVITPDAVWEESSKRVRLMTDISQPEAQKRDSCISAVLESITLLRHEKQLHEEMTEKIKRLTECEEEEKLKLKALATILIDEKDKDGEQKENQMKSNATLCELCCSVIKKAPCTKRDPEESIALLKLEMAQVIAKKEQLEKDLKGLNERVTKAKKDVTCPSCKLRKLAYINMCGHGLCSSCFGGTARCSECSAQVTEARKICLQSQLENVVLD